MANSTVIKAYMMGLYDDLAGVDYVLVQAGDVASKYFRDNMVVSISLIEGKVTVNMKVPIVTQLREFIATLQISFSTDA